MSVIGKVYQILANLINKDPNTIKGSDVFGVDIVLENYEISNLKDDLWTRMHMDCGGDDWAWFDSIKTVDQLVLFAQQKIGAQ